MADKVYRTVMGIVQFDPREQQAAGQDVRQIVIDQIGFREQAVRVYATLWPKFDHVKVEKGDVVVLQGSYTQGKGKNKDTGEPITYHNISVTKLAVVCKTDSGAEVEVVNSDDPADDGDDIPY